MGPAANGQDPFLVFIHVVHRVTITLDHSRNVETNLKSPFVPLNRGQNETRPVLSNRADHPDIPFYRFVFFVVYYRDGGFITLDIARRQNQFL